jgi:hypothetical protein
MAIQRRIEVPNIAASRRFGKYKDEKGKSVREADVREDEVVKSIFRAWEVSGMSSPTLRRGCRRGDNPENVSFDIEMKNFLKAQDALKGVDYSKKDVERFCIMLDELQSEVAFFMRVGLFLSALVENLNDEVFELDLRRLKEPIDNLGWENTKHLTIYGRAGRTLGALMEKGKIVLEGDAGNYAGVAMSGGTLEIKGNAGHHVGGLWWIPNYEAGDPVTYKIVMKGGRIFVRGNADTFIGAGMEGGEIHVDGEKGGEGIVKGGKIYHKGKLIVNK